MRDFLKMFSRRREGVSKTSWNTKNYYAEDVLKTSKCWLGSGSFVRNVKLIEKEEILKDDTEIAEELNLFFSNAVKSLNIAENAYIPNTIHYKVNNLRHVIFDYQNNRMSFI